MGWGPQRLCGGRGVSVCVWFPNTVGRANGGESLSKTNGMFNISAVHCQKKVKSESGPDKSAEHNVVGVGTF